MTSEMVLDDYQQVVMSNTTVTTSGSSAVQMDFGHKETTLLINITSSPTGTSPTLTFTLEEIDPGNGVTVLGTTVTGAALNAIGTQILTLPVTYGGNVMVTWAVTGTTPSFTGVYATIVNKGPSPAIYDQAGHGPVAVKAASTAVAAGDPSLAVGLSPNSPLPAGTNTIGALTANQSVNLAQVAGTTTVTGGVAGSQGIGGLAASGAAVAGNPVLIAGSDGTDARTMATDASGHPIIVGDGVAGTPAGGVVTVQGVSGGTTLPISGTTTANQGTANTLANAWPMEITDGTHGPAAVKAASTAAVATDPALVVAISPNNPITVGAAADVTATGALGALNAAVSVTHPGLMAVGMQLAAGTLIGTVIAESSFDGGTTWNQTFFDSPSTGAITSSLVFGSSNTATAETIVGVGGAGMTRVRVSAYTSGTANVTVRASDMEDPSVLFAGVSGSPVPPTVALVGGTDGTNLVPIRMKAASTAAVATDPAAVVSLSPNSPIPTGSNVIGSILASDQNGSGTITALNGSVTATTTGCSSVSFDITGTWAATLTLQATNGDGNWHTISGAIPTSGTYTNTSTFTANQFVIVACGGFSQVRLTATAYTSGTATIQWNSGLGSNYLNTRVSINPDLTIIHNNATVTTSGQMIITGVGRKEITFGFTLSGTVSGTTPSLTFLVEEVDPVNQTTVMTLPGNSITLGPYNSTGHTNYQEMLSFTGAILVTWTVTGTTPSFGGLDSWVVVKEQTISYGLTFAGTQNPLASVSMDTNSNTIVVGEGTAGTAVGGVLSIQGVSGGVAVPVTGSISATNPSVGTTGSTTPTSATLIGGTDGTNLIAAKIKDASTAAVAADPALVVAPSPNTSGPVQIITPAELVAGQSPATVFPAGFLRVTDEPRMLLHDSFDGLLLDTNNWVPSVAVGGGVAAFVSSGNVTLGTGTTTGGYSYLASQNSFRLPTPGWLVIGHAVTTEFPVTANTYRFWGQGTIPTTPTASSQSVAGNSIVNGLGWELGTDGKLLAVVWQNGVRVIIQDLSAATGNSKQPTDGAIHRYNVYVNTFKSYWYIDGGDVPVATANFVAPTVQTLPLLFLCIAGTSPSSSGSLVIAGAGADDTAKGSISISDGVYGWRKASVIQGGAAATSAASALNVTISPNGLTPGGLVDSLGPQVSAVITDQFGNNQPPLASLLEGILTAINELKDAVVFGGLGAGNGHAQVMISDSHSAPVAIKQSRTHALITDPSLVVQLSPVQQPIPVQAAPQGAVAYNYPGYTTAQTFLQFVGVSENEIFSNAASPSIVSGSALDVLGGTGAWSVVIQYYDQYLNGPFLVQVNLNGTTPVNFANLLPNPLCYIEQVYVNAWGNTYQNQGNLVIWSGAGATGTNIVQMNAGDNQTYFCRHYIPRGTTSFITGMTMSLSAAGIVNGFIGSTPNMNSAGSINIGGQTNMTGYMGGNQGFAYTFPTPIPCVGPNRFYMQAITTITTGLLYGSMSFYDLPTSATQLPPNPLLPGAQSVPSQVSYK